MTELISEGTAEVLNGTVRVGDAVAYAVRDGNTAALRVGQVIGFEERHMWNGDVIRRMKVHVTRASGYRGAQDTDYIGGIEIFERVAKLL